MSAEYLREQRLQLIPMESSNPVVPKTVLTSPYVVHLKRRGGVEVVSCDIYIGRAQCMGGWNLPQSKWANPYTLAKCNNDRKKCIDSYEAHVRSSPILLSALPELAGKSLGCWCAPEDCHGDVLVKLFNEMVKTV